MILRSLAVVTAGESPRDDVVPFLRRHLPEGTEIIQMGVLDGLDEERRESLRPSPGDYVLVSRLADGRSVTLGRDAVEPILSELVERAQEEAGLVLVLCTGDMSLSQTGKVLFPGVLTDLTLRFLTKSGFKKIGVITPSSQQIPQTEEKWLESLGPRIRSLRVVAASPYAWPQEGPEAVGGLKGMDLVVMDCMGYTPQMKAQVAGSLDLPVILPLTLTARLLGEMLEGEEPGHR